MYFEEGLQIAQMFVIYMLNIFFIEVSPCPTQQHS